MLAVVATEQELRALLAGLSAEPAATVIISGIGPAAAAAATATALAKGGYDLVLSLGICGGFVGAAEIGDVVVATDLVAADLGADSPEGFLGMGQLGWSDDEHQVDPALVLAASSRLGEVVTGPMLTVSTVTGTSARAGLLAERHGAVAEAMEGWGVLEAARLHDVPVIEVRAVSNLVGDRDTDRWDFPAAFASLTRIGASLLAEPWC